MNFRIRRFVLTMALCLPFLSGAEILSVAKGDSLRLPLTGSFSEEIEITASLKSNRPNGSGRSKSFWGIRWKDTMGKDNSLTLHWGNSDFGDISDIRYLLLEVSRLDSTVVSEKITEGVELYTGPNTLRMSLDEEGTLQWKIGANSLSSSGEVNLGSPKDAECPFVIFAEGSELRISRCDVTEALCTSSSLMTPYNDKSDFSSESCEECPSGVWVFLDRDMNPKWARLGGRYVLGIMNREDGTVYDIVYLEGAETNGHKWRSGMLKGKLVATPFKGHFNLEWIDSTFNRMDDSDECSATLNEEGTILTLSFPLDHSTLRFYRQN